MEITKEEKDFIINALNHYWNDAYANLHRKDIGDIERNNYTHQLNESKRLIEAFEHSPKPDVSEVPCDHPATDSDAIGIYCSVCYKRLYGV
jgi:1,2-phenylacetyl-CoA epoxidase catalytic subunit